MSSIELPADEIVVRAITDKLYDRNKGRYSSEVFRKTGGTSVSRLSRLSIQEIVEIFCNDLHRPPNSELLGYVQLSVGELKEFGNNFQSNGKADHREITVESKPIVGEGGYADNPAHAEIKEGIPRGLSKKISASLEIIETTC